MNIDYVSPVSKRKLVKNTDYYADSDGNKYPIIDNVLRICKVDNYTNNFGLQWNLFDITQLDQLNSSTGFSAIRFFRQTGWDKDLLEGKNILEVGSGAGRFSRVVLSHTKANLYSVDYSEAVVSNYRNNYAIAPDRFNLCQASIYEMPFLDNTFDKVFCFGVLQHTPSFEASIRTLVKKAKPGAEIVVDFYPIKAWWTKIHSKYIFRPITKKLSHSTLLSLIKKNIDWMIFSFDILNSIGLGVLTRFIPITDVRGFPQNLTSKERKEWAILDTFDAFSPEYDQPQKIHDVVEMFKNSGAKVTFAGFVDIADGLKAAVVRGIKQA